MDELDPIPTDADDEASSLIAYRHSCPEQGRRDGWTPFSRKLFLQVLSETGRVKLALEYCRLSKQSAYALRHRDPLFAAGWDAACHMARTHLADTLFERAIDGFEETVTRNGEVVATRHRFDSRLSTAVLGRLDKRCDRAEEQGAPYLALVARWDEWLDQVGKGEEEQAMAMLESAPAENANNGQLGQLPLGENPTELDLGDEERAVADDEYSFWQDETGNWLTDYPPPENYSGYQHGAWGDLRYKRDCTAEESELLDAAEQSSLGRQMAQAAARRDAYFAALKAELSGSE